MPQLEEIYRAHSQMVFRYLFSLTHDAALAEELTQETFYQAVKSISRFDGSCKTSTWLCGIAKKVLQGYERRHPVAQPLTEDMTVVTAVEDQALAQAGQLELLQRLHRLEGETREVMYLRLLGQLSFREIGEILSHTENWARVTFYRGKEKLKKELEYNG